MPELDRPEFGLARRVIRIALLDRLRLAERVPDPTDGRSSSVRLTDAGTRVAEDSMRAWSAAEEQMFGGVDPVLASQASDTLREVLLALGDREPAGPATRESARG
jgi:DNA-binding MarR family transcriptional regulator